MIKIIDTLYYIFGLGLFLVVSADYEPTHKVYYFFFFPFLILMIAMIVANVFMIWVV